MKQYLQKPKLVNLVDLKNSRCNSIINYFDEGFRTTSNYYGGLKYQIYVN